jgi:hypothetical protein
MQALPDAIWPRNCTLSVCASVELNLDRRSCATARQISAGHECPGKRPDALNLWGLLGRSSGPDRRQISSSAATRRHSCYYYHQEQMETKSKTRPDSPITQASYRQSRPHGSPPFRLGCDAAVYCIATRSLGVTDGSLSHPCQISHTIPGSPRQHSGRWSSQPRLAHRDILWCPRSPHTGRAEARRMTHATGPALLPSSAARPSGTGLSGTG